jgi:ankyrin repeat protein
MDNWFIAAGRKTPADVNIKTLEKMLDDHKGKLDINAADEKDGNFGRTALGYAVQNGKTELLAFLLRRGADIHKFSKDQKVSPLWQAAAVGHTDVCRQLVAGGINVNEDSGYDSNCPTALHVAAYHGKLETVKALLALGADPASKNKNGSIPADSATGQKQYECAMVLKEHLLGELAPLLHCVCAQYLDCFRLCCEPS